MRKFLTFLRYLLIGPEFVVILLGWVCACYLSENILTAYRQWKGSEELIKYIALIPSGILVWILTAGRALLFPAKDISGIIQDWDDYWSLKLGFVVGLFYALVFAGFGLAAWAINWNPESPIGFMLMLVALIGSLLDGSSVYFAQLAVDERIARIRQSK